MIRGVLVHEALTRSVIGAFFEVYNTLGFGFLEHIYVRALERELRAREHRVARELGVRVQYKGEEIGVQRLDMIVDEKLVVETKSGFELHKEAPRQVYNYLRATNLEVGLLLHFGPEPRFFRLVDTHQKIRAHPPRSAASGPPSTVEPARNGTDGCGPDGAEGATMAPDRSVPASRR